MPFLAAVKFNKLDMPIFFDPQELKVEVGEYYIVDNPYGSGEKIGFIESLEARCTCQMEKPDRFKIHRLAKESEIIHWQRQRERESEYLKICRSKVIKYKLDMKVSVCRIEEADNKIVFNYTADQRVDFRELVKDLASALRSRIELWQIGVRDEAKMIDGIDICGQQLCCANWMEKFDPVSIKHARTQDIMRAPSKLAGLCGRLRCCLTFEYEAYLELNQGAPLIGNHVKGSNFEGVVIDRNLIKRQAVVKNTKEGKFHNVDFSEISEKRKASVDEDVEVKKSLIVEDADEGDIQVPDDQENGNGTSEKEKPQREHKAERGDRKPEGDLQNSKPRRNNRNNRRNRNRNRKDQ